MSLSRIDEAFAQMAQGDADAAASVLRGVLRVAPGYTPAYVLCAQACEALHAWPEALRMWQAAQLLAPSLEVARQGVLRATRVMAALRDLADTAPPAEDTAPPPAMPRTPPPPVADPPATHPSAIDTDPGLESDDDFDAPLPPRWSGAATFAGDLDEEEAEDETPDEDALEELPAFNAPPPPPDVFDRDTPEPPAPAAPRTFDLDLDGLIEQLNTQGRIKPRPDLDNIPAPDLDDDVEDMVSETLARIYAKQGQYDEAARIYELLAAQHPENAAAYQREAQALRRKAGDE